MKPTTFIMSFIAAVTSFSPVAVAGHVATSNKAIVHCDKNKPDHQFVKATHNSTRTATSKKARRAD